jgi:hypothetical protein
MDRSLTCWLLAQHRAPHRPRAPTARSARQDRSMNSPSRFTLPPLYLCPDTRICCIVRPLFVRGTIKKAASRFQTRAGTKLL